MSIQKVKANWYYRLTINGKLYNGICEDCKTKEEAKAFDKQKKLELKQQIKEEQEQLQIEELQVDKIAYHSQQIEIIKGVEIIKLEDCYRLAFLKITARKPCEKRYKSKEKFWYDFISFIKDTYKIENANDVTIEMGYSYIEKIKESGRYVKSITYQRGSTSLVRPITETKISNSTVNEIHIACKQVFTLLQDDLKITQNPFDFSLMNQNTKESKDIFTDDEINKILTSNDDFITPIFYIGLYTGLRLGDIVTLKWSEINLKDMVIARIQNKTSKMVTIPILMPLKVFLEKLPQEDEFVLCKQHIAYQHNSGDISEKVSSFLNSLGIETNKKIDSRTRKVSLKGVHSCRHTFATICAKSGIPIEIVKSILGHSNSKVTEIYTNHYSYLEKQKALENFSYKVKSQDTIEDNYMIDIIKNLPEEQKQEILNELLKSTYYS